MPDASYPVDRTSAAWQRATRASRASLALRRSAADRVAASRSRLDHAVHLLNQSDPRVARRSRDVAQAP